MVDLSKPDDSARPERRRPAAVLLLAGLTALLVSAGALTGLLPWAVGSAQGNGLDVRWLLVAAIVVVGLVLVLSPVHLRRSGHHH